MPPTERAAGLGRRQHSYLQIHVSTECEIHSEPRCKRPASTLEVSGLCTALVSRADQSSSARNRKPGGNNRNQGTIWLEQ